MRLAIMQPYFFPYIGYFQLISAVESFVIYDDVNFIKRGWINRNQILAQGSKSWFTLQLLGASQNVLINEVSVGGNRARLVKSLAQCYSKAPQFSAVMPLVEEILMHDESNLAKYLHFSLKKICGHIGLKSNCLVSSSIEKDNSLRGQDKILAICTKLGAQTYVNLPGGKDLYDKARFDAVGIDLKFIESGNVEYRQFGSQFIPNLSILDVLMFNDRNRCSEFVMDYRLVD